MQNSNLSYEELLKMENSQEAVEFLFKRSQVDYLKLFEEMVEQEKRYHTLEHAFPSKPKPGTDRIFDSFTQKVNVDENIELYKKSAAILGKENVIKTDDNLFFNLLFYKFCEDWKQTHTK